jgi:hypothetical protein
MQLAQDPSRTDLSRSSRSGAFMYTSAFMGQDHVMARAAGTYAMFRSLTATARLKLAHVCLSASLPAGANPCTCYSCYWWVQ